MGRCVLAASALALVAVLLLAPLPPGGHGGWESKLLDLGHVPLFAALTVALWFAWGRRWPWPALVAVALAGAAEVAQGWCGRSASVLDFVRGALGVALGVVLVSGLRRPRTGARLAAHATLAAALLAWPVAEAAPHLLDAWDGTQAFPALADFAAERQLLRWQCEQAAIELVADPEQPSGASARIDFHAGPRDYPVAALFPVVRDWGAYRELCCTLTVPEAPIRLVISVRAFDGEGGSAHRQFERKYPPGRHLVRAGLTPGDVDWSRIYCVQFFVYRAGAPCAVLLHRVWLE